VSEPTLNELLSELKTEQDKMARKSRSSMITSVVLVLFLISYLFWIYHRIRPFGDPTFVADALVDIGKAQVAQLIDETGKQLADNSSAILKDGEVLVEDSLGQLRQNLQEQVEQALGEAIYEAMREQDNALMTKLGKHADLVLKSADSPADAKAVLALMTADVPTKGKTKLMADAEAELTKLRDRVRRLEKNRDLSAEEKAERRLILAVLSEVPLPPPAK